MATEDDRVRKVEGKKKTQIEQRARRRVGIQPSRAIVIQTALRNLALGKSRVIQVGHARVEVAIVDHHQMTQVTGRRRVVAVVKIATVAGGKEVTGATANRPSLGAGAEEGAHHILNDKL
jgi:hypothetical protein